MAASGATIREARPGEERAIHALLVRAYAGSRERVLPYSEWCTWMLDDAEFAQDCWFVAEVGGQLAGACLCWTSAFVKDLVVEPEFRRRGIGEALLRHASREFAARGATSLSLKVDPNNPTGAVRLYRRLGFAEAAPPLPRVDEAIRPELRDAIGRAWQRLAGPGTWWTGAERLALARRARLARLGAPAEPSGLPDADAAVDRIAVAPATTSRRWVEDTATVLGEERYVELVGVVSRTVALDTFARLLGEEPRRLPPARAGEPCRVRPAKVERGLTWVAAGRSPIPPTVLALVPDEVEAQNELSDALYMSNAEMDDPDWQRNGLHRTEAELVAAAVSYGNECFF